jgi:hypothetical protein
VGFSELAAWRVRPERVTGNATAERLQMTTRLVTAEFPWSAFARVVRTDSLVLLVLPGPRMLDAHEFGKSVRPEQAQRAETVVRAEQAAVPVICAREFFASPEDFTQFGDWAVAGVPRRGPT